MIEYRNNGAIGALLDEYEKAIIVLQGLIADITPEELKTNVDSGTTNNSCKSIQTILSHVLRSGYWFAVEVRKSLNEKLKFPKEIELDTVKDYQIELNNMFIYNEELFEDYPNIKIDEYDDKKKIKVLWGQTYDTEQLFEHAIVHVLRHRRQIERYLLKIRKNK
jgi:hypothetical protein